MKCQNCGSPPKIKCAKTSAILCAKCFLDWFEEDVHNTIQKTLIFNKGEKIAIGVSGGKDSTVLAHILYNLNKRHDYGLELVLLCIDEGIKGYRDDSIREVRKNEEDLGLPLTILSYKDIYGWTMDEIVAKIGKKNNCTFCGVFRRQALDRGAMKSGCVKLVTGHNADDIAETVLMNVLRGDIARLQRCANAITGSEGSLPRVKPLKYSYEKDIVMYAHHKKLNYFCTECIYAPNSYRSHARTYIKDLERERPQCILDLIYSAESLSLKEDVSLPNLTYCEKCGYISSQTMCKACLLLYGLENNDLTMGTTRKSLSILKNASGTKVSNDQKCGGDCSCEKAAVDF
uniref:Cytoplasmic tRNA 2-thiolation protein 1 n=1 Tax=Acrobeloides nanus TaxID=290746 RepID=A0A914DN93_9BILA